MATELHRGRLIDHIQLVVRDLDASRRFYAAVFEVLQVPMSGQGDDHFWADELFISTPESDAAQGELTGRHHIAFQARDRAMVDAFHRAALAHGGRDNGAPGERDYHPGYWRLRARSRWQQHRGRVPRAGEAQCRVGDVHLLKT
jgi:catechol 2,3-dioxygenase-like lactoylglutathione lyase family enzyme